jgi:hypothetical protein
VLQQDAGDKANRRVIVHDEKSGHKIILTSLNRPSIQRFLY